MGRSRSRSSSRSKHSKSSKHSKKRSRTKSRSRSKSREKERAKKRSKSRESKRNRHRESRSRSRSTAVTARRDREREREQRERERLERLEREREREQRERERELRERERAATPPERVDIFGRNVSKRSTLDEKQKREEEEKKAEIEKQRKIRQQEIEEKLIEEETARRVEELVAKRVEEELEKRKDEIEREVLRRVEEAKRIMEKQLVEELERQRQAELAAQKAREEEEREKREELERILEENNRKIAEAQAKLRHFIQYWFVFVALLLCSFWYWNTVLKSIFIMESRTGDDILNELFTMNNNPLLELSLKDLATDGSKTANIASNMEILQLTRRIENNFHKLKNIQWQRQHMEACLSFKIVPRGLRILKMPTFSTTYPDLLGKWQKLNLETSYGYIRLLIEQYQLIEKNLMEDISEMEKKLIILLDPDGIENFLKDLTTSVKMLDNKLKSDKKKKLERDYNDFRRDQIFSWPRETFGRTIMLHSKEPWAVI
ncbi:arginine and glutamate-rich protein 1 [Protopterus annectens]|uniref:arginine and glutamate-rich protein 1 n=1 Tax=Protopterus annectens TaxID=7888 RepID=UPI001CFB9E18|nr:arginine and glutamate-rich protein 1 [Protopterus annectens]